MLNMDAMLTNAIKSYPEQVGRFSRNLVCSFWDSIPSQFFSNDHPRIYLDQFYGKVSFDNMSLFMAKNGNNEYLEN